MFTATGFNQQDIVKDKLLFWLDVNDKTSYPGTGNTWKDLSNIKNTGTLINDPTYDPSNGGSIVFNGIDEYVDVPYNASQFGLGTGDFTFNVWYNNSGGGDFQRIFTIGIFNVGGNFQFERGGSDRVVVHVNGSFNIYSTPNTAGIWYNFTVVRSAGTVSVYKNASFIGSNIQSGNITNTDNIQIGRDSAYGVYFPGKIPVVNLYNKALTTSEITQNYNAQKGRFGL
jgi:hypothetical protein